MVMLLDRGEHKMTSINFYERFAVVFLTFVVFFMVFYYAYSPVQACIKHRTDYLERELAWTKENFGEASVSYNRELKETRNTSHAIKMYCNADLRW